MSSQMAEPEQTRPDMPQALERLTWESWGEPLLASDSGRVALKVLSWFFGVDYVRLQVQRPGAALWSGDLCPLMGESRVIRVLELAERIAAIREQPGIGALRREASADRQGGYFAHLQALLAIAAPLSTAGWRIDLAPRSSQGSGKKPDLRASYAGTSFCIEVKHLGYDRAISETNVFHDRLFVRKSALERRLQRGLSIADASVCDADELEVWAARVEAATETGATVVDGPGSGKTQILASAESGPTKGAVLDGDLWGRIGMGVQRAARQLEGERRGWVFVEDAGAIAWAAPWSKRPLSAKLGSLIAPARRELAAAPHLAGVVLTTAPRNVGEPVLGQTVWSDGCIAIRRTLVGIRSRETFIIRRANPQLPLRGIKGILGHEDAVAMYCGFDTEGLPRGFTEQHSSSLQDH